MGSGPGQFNVLTKPPERASAVCWAKQGDTIQSKLSTQDTLLRATLKTPESVAMANELIAEGRWELVPKEIGIS